MGDDCVLAGSGDDIVIVSSGKNYVEGGSGNDVIRSSGSGPDVIFGNDGDDVIEMFSASMISGGSGDDVIHFGSYSPYEMVTVFGGKGNDKVVMGSDDYGLVYVNAGQGDDYCYVEDSSMEHYASSTWSIISCENLQIDPSEFPDFEN